MIVLTISTTALAIERVLQIHSKQFQVEAMASVEKLNSAEQLQSIDCPMTKVILFSIIGTVLTKTLKYDPKASVFRNPPELFGGTETHNENRFEKKCQKLICSLTTLHSSQSSKIGKVRSLD